MDPRGGVNPDPRRALPKVDRLAQALREEQPHLPEWAAVEAARRVIERARGELAQGQAASAPHSALQAAAAREAAQLVRTHPRPVVNATGVVLHTNLGRAPLAEGALRAVRDAASGYSDLELDVESGRRGDRMGSLAEKLCLLSGSGGALACNNNAAALLLALNTLAGGREVVVSRGELVEIGGSFRVPDIMERAGVRLVEVGSTNRTHARDYAAAVGPETALLLKVHRSNFEQRGFVSEVSLPQLVEIGRDRGVPVLEDLGSGTLVDLGSRGFPAEAQVAARLAMGPSALCFSGDKLLGGPQAGILLGEAGAIAEMRRNPLFRALRLDKMALAALDWTAGCLLSGRGEQEIPVLRQLLATPGELETRARALAERLAKRCADAPRGERLSIAVEPDRSTPGGGSLPGFELDTWTVALRSRDGASELAAGLRRAPLPVLARVRNEAVMLDLRTLSDTDFAAIEAALGGVLD